MALKGFVDFVKPRNLACFHRQIMTHEGIEMRVVGLLAESDLHRPPELLIQACLKRRLEPHQDKIADEVRLTQLAAGGVHALKY